MLTQSITTRCDTRRCPVVAGNRSLSTELRDDLTVQRYAVLVEPSEYLTDGKSGCMSVLSSDVVKVNGRSDVRRCQQTDSSDLAKVSSLCSDRSRRVVPPLATK